jgi:hypothetical protein
MLPSLRRWLPAALVAVWALVALPAAAALYKWTDANGRVVYSDQPPPGTIKSEIIGGAPPPANPNAVKDMASQDAELKKRQLDRADADKKTEQDKALATRRQDLCLLVRGKIKELNSGQVALYKYNDKGERVYVDDAEKRKELENQQDLEKKYCAG